MEERITRLELHITELEKDRTTIFAALKRADETIRELCLNDAKHGDNGRILLAALQDTVAPAIETLLARIQVLEQMSGIQRGRAN